MCYRCCTCHHQSNRQKLTEAQQISSRALRAQPGKNHDVQAAAPPINTNWCPYDWEASDEVKMILEHNTLLTISSSCYWKSIIRLMGDGDTIVHRFLGTFQYIGSTYSKLIGFFRGYWRNLKSYKSIEKKHL